MIVVYRQVISILAIYIHDEMIIKLCKVSKSYEESKMKSYAKFEKKDIRNGTQKSVYWLLIIDLCQVPPGLLLQLVLLHFE